MALRHYVTSVHIKKFSRILDYLMCHETQVQVTHRL